MTPITEAELKQYEELAAKAGDPPWDVVGNTVYFADMYWAPFLGDEPKARFIATSRTFGPRLAAEVRRLREALVYAAIPLEILARTECDAKATALCAAMKQQITGSLQTVRNALGGQEEGKP